jgi:hypothetical protein
MRCQVRSGNDSHENWIPDKSSEQRVRQVRDEVERADIKNELRRRNRARRGDILFWCCVAVAAVFLAWLVSWNGSWM